MLMDAPIPSTPIEEISVTRSYPSSSAPSQKPSLLWEPSRSEGLGPRWWRMRAIHAPQALPECGSRLFVSLGGTQRLFL